MTFESNQLKRSSGTGARCGFRGKAERDNDRITKSSTLAYYCHQAHSNLGSGIEKTSPRCATQDAQKQARGAVERRATTQEDKMSVFGSIVSAIFGSKHAAGVTPTAGSSSAPPSSPAKSASAGTATGATAAKPISKADVDAILAKLADEQDEDLDWKTSIVDLMKLLKLDSSLGARKQLAQELGYTGALDGSAAMNVWLQKQVMTKLAESGGKVPDSLRA